MSEFCLDERDVATICVERGVAGFWRDRIEEMARESAITMGVMNFDHVSLPFIDVQTHSPRTWPRKKSYILLTRADGARFKLYHRGSVTRGKMVVKSL
jgi:hypothetical protein